MTEVLHAQRIARLTPLAQALERIRPLAVPVEPELRPLADALGCVLAADLFAPADRPAVALAARDGWAVQAEDVLGAGPYAPAFLPGAPVRVDAGAPMPAGADAVLPPEALAPLAGGAEAVAECAAGDGVRRPGADASDGSLLARAGRRLGAVEIGALLAAGLAVAPVRTPRVRILAVREPDLRGPMLAALGRQCGGVVAELRTVPAAQAFRAALGEPLGKSRMDLVLAIGGTGRGLEDCAVEALASAGSVLVHGVAVRPGETAALGTVGDVPVVLLPGRLDALLAAWLVLGKPVLEARAGTLPPEAPERRPLRAKIVSTIGLAELYLLARRGDGVHPTPLDEASLAAILGADGYTVVAPQSEGMREGELATLHPLGTTAA